MSAQTYLKVMSVIWLAEEVDTVLEAEEDMTVDWVDMTVPGADM